MERSGAELGGLEPGRARWGGAARAGRGGRDGAGQGGAEPGGAGRSARFQISRHSDEPFARASPPCVEHRDVDDLVLSTREPAEDEAVVVVLVRLGLALQEVEDWRCRRPGCRAPLHDQIGTTQKG